MIFLNPKYWAYILLNIKTRSKPISSGATSNRETWRDMPWTDQNAAANFKEAWCQKLTAARERHCRAASAVITTDFQCLHCSRQCASRLGLQSHLRVHRWDTERKRHHRIQWITAILLSSTLTMNFGPMGSKNSNTDGRSGWTTSGIMLKRKPHLVIFH